MKNWKLIPEQTKIVSESGDTIASFGYGDFNQSVENAKLAAAAPQMLEVLLDLRDNDYPWLNGAAWDQIDRVIKAATE